MARRGPRKPGSSRSTTVRCIPSCGSRRWRATWPVPRWRASAPTLPCCAMRCASKFSAAHAAPTARSAWVGGALRSRLARRHLSVVDVRYARWDFSHVDLVDPRTGAILCQIKPLDKAANADGQRRRLDRVGADLSPLPPTGLAPLLRELPAEYAATGMPPAYLSPAEPTPPTPTHKDRAHEPKTPRPVRAEVEPLLAGAAHRGDLRAPEAGELLPAHRARADPRGRLRHDPRRPGHRQEHRAAPAGHTPGQVARRDRVGAINHPQSNLADLYRELGDIFAVPLRPHNRWGGFKALRERWVAHLETTASPSGAAGRRGAGDEPGRAGRVAPAGQCAL